MWVWVNSRSWWWTGRPGVLLFMGSQRVGHNWATELNWTEGLDAPGGTVVKNPPTNAGDARDAGSVPGSGRSPGEGNSNPHQYSCLENPHGQRSLEGCSSWGCEEWLHFHFSLSSIGEGNGNPLQCSCLENPMDRRWAIVHRVAKSWTWQSDWTPSHT